MSNSFMVFLQTEVNRPELYGWYHLLCFGLVIGLSVLLGFLFRNAKEKKLKIFLLVTSLILIFFEVYKQIIFSYSSTEQGGVWDYQWYAFPFQFCSTPMYVCLLASLVKKGKLQDALYSFLGTFSLLGGILVMCYPGDVFMSLAGINVQTMVHHGSMIIIGVVLYASKSIKLEHGTILKAIYVFLSLVSIALIGNCIYHWLGGTETMNLFFISPYYPCTLPVLSMIYTKVPYIVFLLLYILAFALISYVVLLFVMLINKISHNFKNRRVNKTTG